MPERFFSNRFQYTWGPSEPSIEIESGATLHVVCPDSDNGLADGTPLPVERRQQSSGSPMFAGNPLAGPIAIRGATPNDCLAIEIETIDLDRKVGATLLAPDHGLLSRDQLFGPEAAAEPGSVPRHLYQWTLDHEQQVAKLANPFGKEAISLPLRPMIGCIGVCPNLGQSISSVFAGDFGGNLDLPLIAPGAVVMLPVFCAGGLLCLGDLHAAQGAGEIVGGGIETSGEATVRVRCLKGRAITSPRLLAGGHIYALATHGDLRTAVSTAYSRLLAWLVQDGKLNRWDGYQLISQAGRLEIGGLVVLNHSTVAAGISLDLLPSHCRREIEAWLEFAGR